MGASKSSPATKEKPLPPDPYDCVRQLDRGTSSLAEKELALEMEFQLEMMRLKELSAEGTTLQDLLRRADNSSFEYAYEPLALPLDEEGFVQTCAPHETEAIRTFFERHGLVVLRDAIDGAACERSVAEVWDFLERDCKGVERADPSTWERFPPLWQLGMLGNTFLLSPQLCQNRQAPDVHRGFAAVFGTERLIVNTGRASAMRPTRRQPKRQLDGGVQCVDRPEWRSEDGAKWLHWDMNPFTGFTSTFSWRVKDLHANKGYERLRTQGILALSECGPDDGGFFCVPGSHLVVRAWAHENSKTVSDKQLMNPESGCQIHLPPNDPLKQNAQKAPIRRGSLLIWDSRLAHSNFPNDSERPRIVQYIQMAEADDPAIGTLCTQEAYLPPADQFMLSDLGKKLYGFSKWE